MLRKGTIPAAGGYGLVMAENCGEERKAAVASGQQREVLQFIVERGSSAFLHVDVPNDHEIFIVIGGSFNILKPPGAVKSTMHNSVIGVLIAVGFSFGVFKANKFA
jgi:hypothetical protein